MLADLAIPPVAWSAPVLIGIFGLPGTGKTHVATMLAQQFPLLILSTDTLRLRYNLPSGPATHAVMYRVATILFSTKVGIIFDGIHMRRTDRQQLRQFAAQHEAKSGLIYTTASPAVVEHRLAERQSNPDKTTHEGKYVITPDHFARIATWLEVPTQDEQVWEVDTSIEEDITQIAQIAHWLGTLGR